VEEFAVTESSRSTRTREAQYQEHVELRDHKGLTTLGLRANATWDADPKRLCFVMARYKFVAKMLGGMNRVLEVGCGDAFATRIVRAEVGSLCAIDFDPVFIEDVCARMEPKWAFECRVHDMLAGPVAGPFDAAFSLDVIEHILQADEDAFVANIARSLVPDGVCIIGAPSLESQAYASQGSKEGHFNCKTSEGLKRLMAAHFRNVFMFSMNDEVVHTGFVRMAHYLLALCAGPRTPWSGHGSQSHP
jgi:2-polyprenyl-3-methyl-5-hydroxy-6-metoxy-1,4-benzoquinol methylase